MALAKPSFFVSLLIVISERRRKMKSKVCIVIIVGVSCLCQVGKATAACKSVWLERSCELMQCVYRYFGEMNTPLLHEYYPFTQSEQATYLADTNSSAHRYSYLWPFSGSFSAQVAIYEAGHNRKALKEIEHKALAGLKLYWDEQRYPAAYASYLPANPLPDRFYDDNVWIGLDFIDLYCATKNRKYLKSAMQVWQFIMSGNDSVLGGGIYWCEQKKESKNTCSNAPGAVMALKLYKATLQRLYLEKAVELYEWTRRNLYDEKECLYSDNINLKGRISGAKYSYNTGQMLQAAVLLYEMTGKERYLAEADTLAEACAARFMSKREDGYCLKLDNIWFDAILLRGILEYARFRNADRLLAIYRKSLKGLWERRNVATGLMPEKKEGKWWLLAQVAYAEMMARLAKIYADE